MMSVDSIGPITGAAVNSDGLQTRPADLVPAPGSTFSDLLTSAVQESASLGHVADAKGDALARGTLDDLHGTMISAKEAEISLHLVGTIRNRLLDAFHELWRTNV
jgi:flagellar hook-basal body complex protein FliE